MSTEHRKDDYPDTTQGDLQRVSAILKQWVNEIKNVDINNEEALNKAHRSISFAGIHISGDNRDKGSMLSVIIPPSNLDKWSEKVREKGGEYTNYGFSFDVDVAPVFQGMFYRKIIKTAIKFYKRIERMSKEEK